MDGLYEKFKYYATLTKEELQERYDAYNDGDYDYGIPWIWFTRMLEQKFIDRETFLYATRANEK